ncbi:hypothetical protein FE697_007010 [Mumia zhuanghuii]|uniref:DUF6636 domain-containing protein n=2 Tax=Mumia TaxID=1546255 RepID=A0ABW1QMD1_9ACTN|nr:MULTISPECIES: DUF6636 domain-containing protein [Mumia]KAA1423357.1 hypothetical protein FE697_007010 [Mumia zhuanghuii]
MHRTHAGSMLAGVALLALTLAGCGSASDVVTASAGSTEAPEPASPSRTATLPLKKVDTDLPKVGEEMPAFRSPTGNIVCRVASDGARCAITDYSFTPPDRPDGCEGSWGGELVLDESGGYFACAVPEMSGNSPELEYGSSTVIGDYGCTSQRTGVVCVHTGSGHGFMVSRTKTGTF